MSLQGLTVRFKYTIFATFTWGTVNPYAMQIIPVLTGGGIAPGFLSSLIASNTAYSLYSNLYDLVQLKWVNLKSILVSFPAGNTSIRCHVLADRRYTASTTDVPPDVAAVPNNPGTLSMMLNASQYNRVGYFVSSQLPEERISWFDATMVAGPSPNGLSIGPNQPGFIPCYFVVLELPGIPTAATSLGVSLVFEIKLRFRMPKINTLATTSSASVSNSNNVNVSN